MCPEKQYRNTFFEFESSYMHFSIQFIYIILGEEKKNQGERLV
jgi:hypothetical protein